MISGIENHWSTESSQNSYANLIAFIIWALKTPWLLSLLLHLCAFPSTYAELFPFVQNMSCIIDFCLHDFVKLCPFCHRSFFSSVLKQSPLFSQLHYSLLKAFLNDYRKLNCYFGLDMDLHLHLYLHLQLLVKPKSKHYLLSHICNFFQSYIHFIKYITLQLLEKYKKKKQFKTYLCIVQRN